MAVSLSFNLKVVTREKCTSRISLKSFASPVWSSVSSDVCQLAIKTGLNYKRQKKIHFTLVQSIGMSQNSYGYWGQKISW